MIRIEERDHATRRDFMGRAVGVAGALGAALPTRDAFAAQNSLVTDSPATHNMMVFGQSTMFLSHLPMFNKLNAQKTDYATPHRFQVILEASLTAPSGVPQQVYFEDRRSHPETRMYTLRPELFVLDTLFPPDATSEPLRSFPAQGVFRGHLERTGNVQILTGVIVSVQRVIYSHKFAVNDKRAAQLEYIVFGKGDELFAAHLITSPPDFDQILPVRITGRTFTAEELNLGVRISIPSRKNAATARLNRQDRVEGQAKAGVTPVAQVQVEAARELYFEEGELTIPPRFNQTAEEKRAGFTEEMLP